MKINRSNRNVSHHSGDDYDSYEFYEEQFNRQHTDRRARRKRKPRVTPPTMHTMRNEAHDLADTSGVEGGFHPTYRPSKYEARWLLSSLETFYDQTWITDVEALIKGGKEASVYRCAAHPRTQREFLAVKVYRPRMFRSLSNDKMYREGRQVLTDEGRIVKETDHRTMRAIGKKSAFGEQVAHTSWLMHEFTTLSQLYEAGAAVPEPVAASDNAILMSYLGDGQMAAPLLNDVRLDVDEARALFAEVLRNVELMLKFEMIHGDLSAYNILYWQGRITIIDFPQVTNSRTNSNAQFILQRDIERICEYFERQGLQTDPAGVFRRLVESHPRRFYTVETEE